jgi:hypothetical protein
MMNSEVRPNFCGSTFDIGFREDGSPEPSDWGKYLIWFNRTGLETGPHEKKAMDELRGIA